MNTTTIRRGIATVAAATAFFACAACGSEIPSPAQDIGGSQQQKKETTPASPTKTSPTRGRFDDEYGTAKHSQRRGARSERVIDPVDRTREWH